MAYGIHPLFATPVIHIRYEGDNQQLIDYCYEEKKKEELADTYSQRSGKGSWQSIYLNIPWPLTGLFICATMMTSPRE